MNKKYVGFLGVLVLIIIVTGAWLFLQQANNKSSSSTITKKNDKLSQVNLRFSDVIASYPRDPKNCLATNEDSAIKIEDPAKTSMEMAVISAIIDIPAGTNVDVYFKTHEKTKATGTSIYESTYGSYNFVAHKVKSGVTSEKGDWVVTEFVACKK